MGGGLHSLLKIYTQTKLDGVKIDNNEDSVDLLRKSEKEDNLYRFRKDIYFCTYKTTIEDKNAVILIFTIKLPNTTTGSSASSEIVMNIVELLENSFAPIDEYNFLRNIDGVNKNIAILRVTKIIEPDYIIGEEIEN